MQPRILLVDDRRANLLALEALLEDVDCEVVTTTSAHEALRIVESDPPDLVIADLRMPEMDGTELLTRIRSLAGPHIPVLVATAFAEREARLMVLEAGADDFLEKPIDPPVLLARVRTLLKLRSSARLLAERNTALERLQQQQRELTGFIVHDLKNPLAAARMNVGWVLEQADRDDFKEALGDATEGIERVTRMVQDLLIVSKLECGAAPLRKERVGVSPLLDRLVRSQARLAEERGIALSVGFEEDGLEISGDHALLARVFENLLDNALRHTPTAGRIAIAARRRGMIEIDVANTGNAIPAAARNVIFAQFGQAKEQVALTGNVGLGLYFCKHAVAAHGGNIGLTDRAGWPTAFRVQLPAA